MKKVLLAFALLSMCVPGLGLAQETQSCWDCTIGIFDTEELILNYGDWDPTTNPSKTFYVGITYDPAGSFDGLTGVEFSILGLPATFLPPTIAIRDGGISFGESIETPADTTDPAAEGGWNIVWSECQPGNRTFVEITMISFDPVPDNTVIRVLRKFPPSNPTTPNSLFTMCDFPLFSKVVSTGGCYVLNPVGVGPGETVDDCTLASPDAVSQTTWSAVKELYR